MLRVRIVRPLPMILEGVDVTHLRFGASYELPSPLSDLLIVTGYGIPEDIDSHKPPSATAADHRGGERRVKSGRPKKRR